MKAGVFRDTVVKFYNLTKLNLRRFVYVIRSEFFFDAERYLAWCQGNGMLPDESIEEFNVRHFYNGRRVNKLIEEMIG